MGISDIKSPDLEIIIPNYQESEIVRVYDAIREVNDHEIAYNALTSSFLFNKITKDIRYSKHGNMILIYSHRLDETIAKICFPAPIKRDKLSEVNQRLTVTENLVLVD